MMGIITSFNSLYSLPESASVNGYLFTDRNTSTCNITKQFLGALLATICQSVHMDGKGKRKKSKVVSVLN
jgi:hypothetical protein